MVSQELENCIIQLRNATKDEEIMIGLTLLPRLLHSNDQASMEYVYANIPWGFVHRLMLTRMNSLI
jgi:hypothetical protein